MRNRPDLRLGRFVAVFVAALAVLAGALGVAAPATAAVGSISGIVVEAGTATPLAGMEVNLYEDGVLFDINLVASTTTDASGQYAFALATGGDYTVAARSDDWVESSESVTGYDPVAGFVVPNLELEPGVVLTGIVRDAQTGDGIPNVIIFAFDPISGSPNPFASLGAFTDATGAYRVTAPLDADVQLLAFSINSTFTGFQHWPQVWDHRSFLSIGCSCTDVIETPSAQGQLPSPPPGYDFDLWSFDNAYIAVEAWDVTAGDWYAGLTAHLYKKSGNTWAEVDFRDTDSIGLADLYGPQAVALRLRFSVGGDFVPESAEDFETPANPLTLGSQGCWVELGSLTTNPSSPEAFGVAVELDTTRPKCPATMPTGGSPVVPPASTPVDLSGFTSTPSPAPSATPTPTPTPTSEPSAAPSPEPSESVAPEPDPAAASGDLWWVWLLVGILGLAIVIAIGAMMFRRR